MCTDIDTDSDILEINMDRDVCIYIYNIIGPGSMSKSAADAGVANLISVIFII
jgi:hypothetical protein